MKSGFNMSWDEARKWILSNFGDPCDCDIEDKPCFYCPFCEEPIYKEDYPYLRINFDGEPLCPICEDDFE